MEGETDDNARIRRVEVLRLLRRYNDPGLWHHVSALVAMDGCLDIRKVTKSTDVANLEWLLTSDVTDDLVDLR